MAGLYLPYDVTRLMSGHELHMPAQQDIQDTNHDARKCLEAFLRLRASRVALCAVLALESLSSPMVTWEFSYMTKEV